MNPTQASLLGAALIVAVVGSPGAAWAEDSGDGPGGPRDEEKRPPSAVELQAPWLGAGGGVLLRDRFADFAFRVDFGLGLILGLGLHFELLGVVSKGIGVDVVDLMLGIGPNWRFHFGESLTLRVGASGGMRVHRYDFSAGGGGTEVDWSIAFPAELGWGMWSSLDAKLTVQVGFVGRDIQREVAGAPVWRRSAWHVAALLGLGYDFSWIGEESSARDNTQ